MIRTWIACVTRRLATLGLVVAAGCGTMGPGTVYFTFLLKDAPVGTGTGDVYMYLVWREVPVQDIGLGCFLHEFDFVSRAERAIGEQRTTDTDDQSSESYVHYLGDGFGNPVANCVPTLDAQFDYDGAVYHVRGTVIRDFAQVRTLTIGGNDPSFIKDGSWTIDGMSVTGAASFWPWEQGPDGSIQRQLYPTEPGGR